MRICILNIHAKKKLDTHFFNANKDKTSASKLEDGDFKLILVPAREEGRHRHYRHLRCRFPWFILSALIR